MFSSVDFSKITVGMWALIGLMLATRFHHFGSAFSLPDASLAVFFMAGLWFRGRWLLLALLAEAALIDYLAISQFSVSDYCISPAYGFLIPTYALMFFAGQCATRFNTDRPLAWVKQLGLLVGATVGAFLISNASFYLLSGRFAEMHWIQYAERVSQYVMPYLTSTVLYSVVIIATIKLLSLLRPLLQNKIS